MCSWRQSTKIQPVLDVVSEDHGTGIRVTGVTVTQRIACMGTKSSLHVQSDSWLIYAHLLAGGLGR